MPVPPRISAKPCALPLLPDSDLIRRRVAEQVGAEAVIAYSLLARIGRDCVGALQLLPEGEAPGAARTLTGEQLSDTQIGAMLQDLAQTPLGISERAMQRKQT